MKKWTRHREAPASGQSKLDIKGKALLIEAEDEEQKVDGSASRNAIEKKEGAQWFGITGMVADEAEKDEIRKLLEEDDESDKEARATKAILSDGDDSTPPAGQRKIDWHKKMSLQCQQSLLFVEDQTGISGDADIDPLMLIERSKVRAKELGSTVNSVSGLKFVFVMERVDWIEELFVLRTLSGKLIKVNLNGDLVAYEDQPEAFLPNTYERSASFESVGTPSISRRVSTSELPPHSPPPTALASPSLSRQPLSITESITSFSAAVASTLSSTFSDSVQPLFSSLPSLYFYVDSEWKRFDEEILFRRERQDRKTYAIKSYYTGKYLTVEADGRVTASSDDIGPCQKFQFINK